MRNLIAVSLALLVGFAQAACPNSCSGHGTCGVDEVVRLLFENRSSFRNNHPLTLPFRPIDSAHAILDGAQAETPAEIAPNDSALSN